MYYFQWSCLVTLSIAIQLTALQSFPVSNRFLCNSLLLPNIIPPEVTSTHYGVSSTFFCANLCYQTLPYCVTYRYDRSNIKCILYTGSWFPSLLIQGEHFCQRADYVSPTVAPTPPAWVSGCATGLTSFTKPGIICPSLANCTCNGKGLGASDVVCSSADACYNSCSTTINCLAFSYIVGYCRVATAQYHLALYGSTGSFVCYC